MALVLCVKYQASVKSCVIFRPTLVQDQKVKLYGHTVTVIASHAKYITQYGRVKLVNILVIGQLDYVLL